SVRRQRAAAAEVERLPVEIRDAASGLLDADDPRSVVPDPLAAAGLRRRAEAVRERLVGVAGFDGLAETQARGVVLRGHARYGAAVIAAVHRQQPRASA